MGVNRRTFIKRATGVIIASGLGLSALAAQLKSRAVKAVTRGKFPGKITPVDDSTMSRPGRWLG